MDKDRWLTSRTQRISIMFWVSSVCNIFKLYQFIYKPRNKIIMWNIPHSIAILEKQEAFLSTGILIDFLLCKFHCIIARAWSRFHLPKYPWTNKKINEPGNSSRYHYKSHTEKLSETFLRLLMLFIVYFMNFARIYVLLFHMEGLC